MTAHERQALAPWLQPQLDRLLAQRGHARLLQGPSGLGQLGLADALVRAWLCEAPSAQGACGRCASCHAIDVHTHADLFVLMPETTLIELGWPLDEKSQDDIDNKRRKPSREIRIEAMRAAVEFSQRTSSRGRGKAVLIYPAERMNSFTANALLKTLEEPPGDVRFVLASEAAHLLLPTIRSRCQTYALDWPAHQQSLDWLVQQGLDGGDAALWLQAAGGRPEAAQRMAAMSLPAARWRQMPQAIARGDLAALEGFAPVQIVDVLQKLCHDLMRSQQGSEPRFFAADDLPRPPSLRALSSWAGELSQIRRSAEHPYNPGLLLEALVSRAQLALNSQRR